MASENEGGSTGAARELFVGVDGGKTETLCLLATRDGEALGWGKSGWSDKQSRPLEDVLDEIQWAVERACQTAGVALQDVSYGAFGLAGADWHEDFVELQAGLERRGLARTILVKNDMHIALRANVPTGAGVLISGGTHLAAAIRLPDGREYFSGMYSVDGMGGLEIGKRTFWAVMRAEDGRGPQTALTDLLLQYSGMQHPDELLRAFTFGKIDDAFFATLPRLLFQAHLQTGDPVAAGIILHTAWDMSLWATGLLVKNGLAEAEIPVVITGGLFKTEDPLLVEAFTANVLQRAPRAQVQRARYEPVIGALLYAYELGKTPITPALVERAARSANSLQNPHL